MYIWILIHGNISLGLHTYTCIYMYKEGMWFLESRRDSIKKGTDRCRNSVAVRKVSAGNTCSSIQKCFEGFGVVILLNNWISTEPRSVTLSTADLFCWIWSYSKWSQIILPSRQENLKAFKSLCPKRCLKSARAAHRTQGPQNALELFGSIKLSILYRILMHLGLCQV